MDEDHLNLLQNMAANGMDHSALHHLPEAIMSIQHDSSDRRRKVLGALIILLANMQRQHQQMMMMMAHQRVALITALLLRRRRRRMMADSRKSNRDVERQRWLRGIRRKRISSSKDLDVRVPKFRMSFLKDRSFDLPSVLGVPHHVFWLLIQMCATNPKPKSHHLSQDVELALFLYWLYTGAPLWHVGYAFGVGCALADAVVMRTLRHLYLLVDKHVHFPSEQQARRIGAGFASSAGSRAFGTSAGALVVTEVGYRTGSDVMMQQLLVDHRSRILNSFTTLTRSNCKMILRSSPLYKRCAYSPSGKVILASRNFPCLSSPLHILPPYSETSLALTSPEAIMFNIHHSLAMAPAKRALRLLRTRWPAVYTRPLGVSPHIVPMVLSVCTLLHNVCLQMGWEEPHGGDPSDEEDEDGAVDLKKGEKDGEELRRKVADQLLSREDGDYNSALQEMGHDHDYAMSP